MNNIFFLILVNGAFIINVNIYKLDFISVLVNVEINKLR